MNVTLDLFYSLHISQRFLFTASSKVATYLSSIDAKYNSLFMDTFWKNLFLKSFLSEPGLSVMYSNWRRLIGFAQFTFQLLQR